MKKHGTFTSIWDGGTRITTPAILDTETGRIEAESVSDGIEDLDCLDEEFFTDDDGNRYDVCEDCHCHILKEKDITETDEQGNELPEISGIIICSDPYCDSNLI